MHHGDTFAPGESARGGTPALGVRLHVPMSADLRVVWMDKRSVHKQSLTDCSRKDQHEHTQRVRENG